MKAVSIPAAPNSIGSKLPAARRASRPAPQVDTAEQVILVDAKDRECGAAPKLLAHRQGLRHRAFSVMVWDGQGRLLLQRRAGIKYHSGGLWSNSCCGHPRPGEATDEAAARRLEEEMGIRCGMEPVGKVAYGVRFDNGLAENEVVTVFAALHTGTVTPCPAEVEDVGWVSLPHLVGDVRLRPNLYTYWFRLYVMEHPHLFRDGARA